MRTRWPKSPVWANSFKQDLLVAGGFRLLASASSAFSFFLGRQEEDDDVVIAAVLERVGLLVAVVAVHEPVGAPLADPEALGQVAHEVARQEYEVVVLISAFEGPYFFVASMTLISLDSTATMAMRSSSSVYTRRSLVTSHTYNTREVTRDMLRDAGPRTLFAARRSAMSSRPGSRRATRSRMWGADQRESRASFWTSPPL